MKLNTLLDLMEPGISDLHLIVGEPPIFRSWGKLIRREAEPLTEEEITEMLVGELPERLQARFALDRRTVLSSVTGGIIG